MNFRQRSDDSAIVEVMVKSENDNPYLKIVEEIFNSITHGLGAIAAAVAQFFAIIKLS